MPSGEKIFWRRYSSKGMPLIFSTSAPHTSVLYPSAQSRLETRMWSCAEVGGAQCHAAWGWKKSGSLASLSLHSSSGTPFISRACAAYTASTGFKIPSGSKP